MPRHLHLLTPLGLAYALAILLWRALHSAVGDTWWWVGALSDLALPLLAPAPLLLALALWRRRGLATLVLLPPTLVGALIFGRQLLPRPIPTPPPGTHVITALTYNVLFRNRDFAAMEAAIRAAQPDVVGLQEITPRLARTLAADLAADLPYHAMYLPEGQSGVLLLSRHPIEASAPFDLPPRQSALHARVRVGAASVHVLVAHLVPSRRFNGPLAALPARLRTFYDLRAIELAAIEREVAASAGPLLLLCDCNLVDTSAAADRMRATLGDSFQVAGWGLGLSNPAAGLPLQRIDYVWHSRHFTPLMAALGPPGGSDHRPVAARLAW